MSNSKTLYALEEDKRKRSQIAIKHLGMTI